MHKDALGDRFGMWIFLFTELVLFGTIFVLYAVYFHGFHEDFIRGGKMLDLTFGTVNTIILLISSFTVAASISALRKGKRNLSLGLLGFSILVAIVFLINKYFEWSHKIHLEIFPNSEWLRGQGHGLNLYFGLYYLTTGLHALHVFIGGTLLTIVSGLIYFRRVDPKSPTFLENCGLYWHLVDLIWIFVFPLYYLVS